jgi:uncharacterized protein
LTILWQPPKLVEVSTEESSQQLTPLSQEQGELPVTTFGGPLEPASRDEDKWLAWYQVAKAVAVWFASFALLLVVPVIVALPYLIYKVVKVGPPSPEALQSDTSLIFYSVLGILPAHLLTLVVTWMIVSEGGRRPFWKGVGFEWPQKLSPKMVTLASILLALVLLALAWLVTSLYGGGKTQLDFLIESSVATRFATAFVAVVTAPLVEEVIYRGVLYSALEKAAGVTIAIVVVSLLFAGVHVFQYINNISVIIVITLLSITLTVARAVTGKVLPSFIIHLVFNGVQSLLIVLGAFVKSDALK